MSSQGYSNLSERRASQRFLIECKAEYRVISRGCAEVSGWGQTVNVSSSGILLTVEHVLSVGWRMEVIVDWPVRLDDKIPLKWVLKGQVVRSATREVALSIKRYQFRTAAHSGIDVKKAEETANAGIPSIWADPDPSEIAAT